MTTFSENGWVSRGAQATEARAALPLDGGVKADSPHGRKTERKKRSHVAVNRVVGSQPRRQDEAA